MSCGDPCWVIVQARPRLAGIYFTMYVAIVFFVMINIIIGIITKFFDEVSPPAPTFRSSRVLAGSAVTQRLVPVVLGAGVCGGHEHRCTRRQKLPTGGSALPRTSKPMCCSGAHGGRAAVAPLVRASATVACQRRSTWRWRSAWVPPPARNRALGTLT